MDTFITLLEGGIANLINRIQYILTQTTYPFDDDDNETISVVRFIHKIQTVTTSEGEHQVGRLIRKDRIQVPQKSADDYHELDNLIITADEQELRNHSLFDSEWFENLINTARQQDTDELSS